MPAAMSSTLKPLERLARRSMASPNGASQPRTRLSHFFQPAENLSQVSRCWLRISSRFADMPPPPPHAPNRQSWECRHYGPLMAGFNGNKRQCAANDTFAGSQRQLWAERRRQPPLPVRSARPSSGSPQISPTPARQKVWRKRDHYPLLPSGEKREPSRLASHQPDRISPLCASGSANPISATSKHLQQP